MFSHHLEKNESDGRVQHCGVFYIALKTGVSRISLVKPATVATAGPLLTRGADEHGQRENQTLLGGSPDTVSNAPLCLCFLTSSIALERCVPLPPVHGRQCE